MIAEWDRNSREVVRVALDIYNGRHTINLRVWYRDGNELRPTKSGLTLSAKHAEPLANALAAAVARAREMGLLGDGGDR